MKSRTGMRIAIVWSLMGGAALADRVYFDVINDATAAGSLMVRMQQPAADCNGTVIAEVTVNYDDVAGGANATTAPEIAAAIDSALDMVLPDSDYEVGNGKKDQPPLPHSAHVSIRNTDTGLEVFDICVEGDKIVANSGDGADPHTEGGVTLRWQLTENIPAASFAGVVAMLVVVTALGVLIVARSRRSQLGSAAM